MTASRIYTVINKIGLEMVKLYSDVKHGLEKVRFNNEYGFILGNDNSGKKKKKKMVL